MSDGSPGQPGQARPARVQNPVPCCACFHYHRAVNASLFCSMPVLRPAHHMVPPKMTVTTLPNGLRVASQENFGQISTLALFVDAGSMYESEDQLGACHFIEAAAFGSTSTRSSSEVQQFAQSSGITTQAVMNREVVMFKVSVAASPGQVGPQGGVGSCQPGSGGAPGGCRQLDSQA
jgi:hypothetical protein